MERVDSSPFPSLQRPANDFLQGFFNNPQGFTQGLNQPSALQSHVGNTFSQLVNGPSASQRAFDTALPGIQQQLSGMPGQDILDASQPIFQRNMQMGADTLRQAGPRFNSNTERLIGEQGNRAMQDYNLFSQNVMESGRSRQLQAAQVLGFLGGGADSANLANLQGAGSFANQMSGQNSSIMQALMNAGLTAGGAFTPPTYKEHKPWWQQGLGIASTAISLYGQAKGAGMFGKGGGNPQGRTLSGSQLQPFKPFGQNGGAPYLGGNNSLPGSLPGVAPSFNPNMSGMATTGGVAPIFDWQQGGSWGQQDAGGTYQRPAPDDLGALLQRFSKGRAR